MPGDTPHPQQFSISDLAVEFDVSPRTIRFYEEKGLLAPARTKGNQRVYNRRDRARLRLILRGKRFGYRLDEIADMIGLDQIDMDEADQIRQSLAYGGRKLAEIHARIEELSLLEKDLQAVAAKLRRRLEALEERR